MSTEDSVSQWIASLRTGDLAAVEKLWHRYKVRLTELAGTRLQRLPKGITDEDDIAQSVFLSVYRGAMAGRFEDLKNRDELWWLLLALTKQKIANLARRETAKKRGGGRVQSGSFTSDTSLGGQLGFDLLIGDQPTPESLLILEEEHRRLLAILPDDRLRRIAVSRIEGYSVPEIASKLEVSVRSVERKLQLIRNAWAKEFAGVGRNSKAP
jgi:DNA-directed RNA polymerase specialized sigma24 family protein